jgi:glutaconyl-CoA/methylmalonyl-CoA decarboxylase subunit gamma
MKYKIAVNDRTFEVEINDIKEGIAQVNVDGRPYDILIENYEDIAAGSKTLGPALVPADAPASGTIPKSSAKPAPISPQVPKPATDTAAVPVKPATPTPAPTPKKVQAAGEIVAPIPGRILEIKVNVGDPVAKGQTVATMEAMKMENNIASTLDGVVQTIRVQKDSEVATGEVIMIIE